MLQALSDENFYEEKRGLHLDLLARVKLHTDLLDVIEEVLVNELDVIQLYQTYPEYIADVWEFIHGIYQSMVLIEGSIQE
jgi:hypothetical protein